MYLTHRLSLASEAHKPPAVGEDDQDDEDRHSGKDADDDHRATPGTRRTHNCRLGTESMSLVS